MIKNFEIRSIEDVIEIKGIYIPISMLETPDSYGYNLKGENTPHNFNGRYLDEYFNLDLGIRQFLL